MRAAGVDASSSYPGFYLLADDGSRDQYCIDLRRPDRGVLCTDIASFGWADAEPLGLSIEDFIHAIDEGTFNPYPSLRRGMRLVGPGHDGPPTT